MRGILRDVLARRGTLGLALAVAAALALVALAESLVYLAVLLPYSELVDDDLAFTVKGTSVGYGTLLEKTLVLALVAIVLVAVWRAGRESVRLCPDCRSEVDRAATICPMCTSEIGDA